MMDTDEKSTSPLPYATSSTAAATTLSTTTTTASFFPPPLLPIDIQLGISRIACGKSHALFLTSHDGEVLGLGSNSRGQLGLEGVFEIPYDRCPERIEALEGVKMTRIACGGWHSLAVSADGDVYCWGFNDCGQCAVPFQVDSRLEKEKKRVLTNRDVNKRHESSYDLKVKSPPRKRHHAVEAKEKEDKIAPSLSDECANLEYEVESVEEEESDEKKYEDELQTGPPRSQTLPTPFPFEESIMDVAAGSRHSLFLMKNGTVFSCGSNKWGQLGREVVGNEESDWRPQPILLDGGEKRAEEKTKKSRRTIEKIWAGWWNSFLY